MKYQVELISCLLYKDKDGDMSTRLGYRFLGTDFLQDSDKFKGYSEISYFCKGTDIFDKLTKKCFGVQAELTMEERPGKVNPTRRISVLKSIKIGDELINLL